jgi:hypothetical protein
MLSSPACSQLMGTTRHLAGSARRAAKVLWVAASGCSEDGRRRLWLWAVDRLSGVTMNGASLDQLSPVDMQLTDTPWIN